MAFGQGETIITPLEQAVAYATFANGGTRYAPEVAAGIVSPDGKVIKRFAPKVTGHVSLPPDVYQPILDGIRGGGRQTPTGPPIWRSRASRSARSRWPARPVPRAVTGEEPTSWFVAFGPVPDPQYVRVPS